MVLMVFADEGESVSWLHRFPEMGWNRGSRSTHIWNPNEVVAVQEIFTSIWPANV